MIINRDAAVLLLRFHSIHIIFTLYGRWTPTDGRVGITIVIRTGTIFYRWCHYECDRKTRFRAARYSNRFSVFFWNDVPSLRLHYEHFTIGSKNRKILIIRRRKKNRFYSKMKSKFDQLHCRLKPRSSRNDFSINPTMRKNL